MLCHIESGGAEWYESTWNTPVGRSQVIIVIPTDWCLHSNKAETCAKSPSENAGTGFYPENVQNSLKIPKFVTTLFSRGAGSGHRWGQPGIEWWCGFSLILQCYQLSCMTMVRMRQLTGLSLSSVGTTSCVATGGGALWTGPMSAMRSWCWWWGACLTWTPSGGRVGTHRIETVLVQTLSWDRIY